MTSKLDGEALAQEQMYKRGDHLYWTKTDVMVTRAERRAMQRYIKKIKERMEKGD